MGKPVKCCKIKMKTEPLALTKKEMTGNLKSHCSEKMRTKASWNKLTREWDIAN